MIVFSFRQWLNRVLFIVLFVILLIIAVGGYRWLLGVVSPIHPHKEPRGAAVKVFVTDPASPDGNKTLDRLRWFYWYGE